MINADMRLYNYFTLGGLDEYGQRQLPAKDAQPEGKIKMAIYTTTQSVQQNINYLSAQYIGLTAAAVNDKYIIEYGAERLKVLYVNQRGRLKQVYLSKI